MSLLPTIGDIINLRVHCYNPGTSQAAVNDYGYVLTAVPLIAPPAWQDLVQGFDVVLSGLMKACIANAARYSGVAVECVEPAPYPVTAGSVGGAGPGTGGANMVPDQMAALIRRRTALRGPSERGRTYMPFLPTGFMGVDGYLDKGNAGVGYYPLMQALYGTLVAGDNDVHPITIVGDISGENYSMYPAIIHRVPKPGVSTSTAILEWVNLEPEMGALKKRGDWGRMNVEFAG